MGILHSYQQDKNILGILYSCDLILLNPINLTLGAYIVVTLNCIFRVAIDLDIFSYDYQSLTCPL